MSSISVYTHVPTVHTYTCIRTYCTYVGISMYMKCTHSGNYEQNIPAYLLTYAV